MLRVVSCNFKKINLRGASSFLRVVNLFCELEIKLRVASCFLGVFLGNLRNLFYEFQIAFYELQLLKITFYELPAGFYELEV